jgi:hypothetical protein
MTAIKFYGASTSTPSDGQSSTGAGSLFACLAARGIVLQRQTPQGSMRPFGQDMGTAADDTVGTAPVVLPQS